MVVCFVATTVVTLISCPQIRDKYVYRTQMIPLLMCTPAAPRPQPRTIEEACQDSDSQVGVRSGAPPKQPSMLQSRSQCPTLTPKVCTTVVMAFWALLTGFVPCFFSRGSKYPLFDVSGPQSHTFADLKHWQLGLSGFTHVESGPKHPIVIEVPRGSKYPKMEACSPKCYTSNGSGGPTTVLGTWSLWARYPVQLSYIPLLDK